MARSASESERAVDRLTLQLISDAYGDLAAILQNARPQAMTPLREALERRVTEVLVRVCHQRSEGDASEAIAIAVGERIGEILEQAHAQPPSCQAA